MNQPRTGFPRDGIEFGRVVNFTDAVFAIALTLLIVTVTVPVLHDAASGSEMLTALKQLLPRFFGFFLGFILLANYWAAHHRFFATLDRADNTIIGINLVYLAFVAFLPFPTGLFGTYTQNPVAASLFALNIAVLSGMEVVEMLYARRAGLARQADTTEMFRFTVIAASLPVVLFLLSIPIAFVSTQLVSLAWILIIPVERFIDRWSPDRRS